MHGMVHAVTPPERWQPVADCVFCRIVAGTEPATVLAQYRQATVIVPLNPVVDGHVLVVANGHQDDFTTGPHTTGAVMRWAAEYARDNLGDCNLITSKGRAATQSVFHLHVHLVPRATDDGLALPWYSGRRSRRNAREVANAVPEHLCPGTDGELTYCHDYGPGRGAEMWGPCGHPDCSGSCQFLAACTCVCHKH